MPKIILQAREIFFIIDMSFSYNKYKALQKKPANCNDYKKIMIFTYVNMKNDDFIFTII